MKKLLAALLMLPALAFAAKVPLVSHSHVYGIVAANQTVYIPVGDTVISSSTVEAHVAVPFYKAGTFSGMYARLETNSLTGYCTFYLRINGVRGNSFVALAPGVKIGTDTVNTDTISSGDKVDYEFVTGAGTDVLPVANLINFAPADGSYYQRFTPAAPAGGYLLTNGYQPYYSNITGIMGQNFYDHHTFHVMRTSGTFQNFAVYVSTNSRGLPTNFALYKNGFATALSTTASPGAWGLLQQTTTTVSVVVGDTVAITMNGVDGADSNPINLRFFSMEFINNTGLFEWGPGTDDKPQNAGESWTMPFKGALTFGGDEYLLQANSTGTLSNFCVYITQNDVSTISTVKVRKDGATDASVTMTIPAASTGTFCDNTNSISFVSTTTLGYLGNSPAGTGTLYYASIMAKATMEGSSGGTGRPVITPSIPIVNVNTTQQFSSTHSVTWSLLPGSTGTISAGGLYTAPGPIVPKQTIYGIVTSPQDMIWNTDISSLPVQTSSTNYMRSQAGGASITFEPDMPMNIYSNATSSQTMEFKYTPALDGPFKVADIYKLRMEQGIFADKDIDKDTHVLAIDTNTALVHEMYKLYPAGTEAGCAGCTSQSGLRHGNRYNVELGVTAGGLPITSLQLKYRELRECVDNGVPIKHALRMTFSIGILSSTHNWPAVAHANDGGALPFGTYVRLVSTYPISGTAPAQCIKTALKKYGAIVDDGGTNGHIQIEQAAIADYDLFNAIQVEMFADSSLNVNNLEVVDVSSLHDLDINSPTYDYHRVTSTNPYVVPSNFAVVRAVNISDGTSSYMPIIVQPITIGTEREVGYSFMAGASAYQIPLWVKSASDASVSCSMSPTLGSLTAGGEYTPPTSVTSRSSTTATCTATADAGAKISFPLIVYSSSAIRVRLQNVNNSNYGPDTNGNTWFSEKGGEWRLQGHANCDWSGESWGVTDEDLYQECMYTGDGTGDYLGRFIVPNGSYRIKLWFANGDTFSTDTWGFGVDSQQSIYSGSSATSISGNGAWTFFGLTGKYVDLCNVTGSCAVDTPGSITLTPDVTNQDLYFAIRKMNIAGDGTRAISLNAFEIVLTTPSAGGGGGGSGISGNGVIWRR